MSNPRAQFPILHLSLPQQIRASISVLNKAKQSPALLKPDSYLDELGTTTQELSDADQSVVIAKKSLLAAIATRKTKEAAFHKACFNFAGHVTLLAKGDREVILETGLLVQRAANPAANPMVMTKPLAFVASSGPKAGEVRLHWKSVKGAKSYLVHRSQDNGQTFLQVEIITARTTLLEGQPSNTPLWYRIAAVGPSGQSPWTDPAAVVTH